TGLGPPDPRQYNVAINERTGALYMVGRHLGVTSGTDGAGLGNLIAFNTAGRVVGGTTTTFTTLINGATYAASNPPTSTQYIGPNTVIYRKRAGSGSDDTVLIAMQQDAGVRPVMEFWLDTTAHPSGNAAYLAFKGVPISVPRGWNGSQDRVTG